MCKTKHERRLERINYLDKCRMDPIVPGSIHSTSFINDCVEFEEEGTVTIGPLVSIGWCGIGVEWEDNKIKRMPQFGKVWLAKDVFICASAVIDRGPGDDDYTRIGQRSIIGPKTHICHNVQIGKDTLVLGDAIICGGAKIGERCMIGANSTIKNKVVVGNDVVIGMGAVVTKDVPDGVTAMGNPARW